MINYTESLLNTDKSISYFDSPIYKQVDSNGQLTISYNSEALSTAFTLWLVSGKGDNLKSVNGGYLKRHLGKPMSEQRANEIRRSILVGMENEFKPAITVVDLKVISDFKKNRWIITLIGYNEQLNIGITSVNAVNN